MSYFIASYKGGRNESYMYGVDETTLWYDYDLISAYTTGMTLMGHPDYERSKMLDRKTLEKLPDVECVENYLVMAVKFKFPKKIKYPSIPCYANGLSIYPLEGEAVITGIEYMLARNQGCKFEEIKDIFMIPFQRDTNKDDRPLINQPFASIIGNLQSERAKFDKGTLGNLMAKEKGNSIYGNVVKGMSNKKKFDIKSKRTVRMEASDLSNPILAS